MPRFASFNLYPSADLVHVAVEHIIMVSPAPPGSWIRLSSGAPIRVAEAPAAVDRNIAQAREAGWNDGKIHPS